MGNFRSLLRSGLFRWDLNQRHQQQHYARQVKKHGEDRLQEGKDHHAINKQAGGCKDGKRRCPASSFFQTLIRQSLHKSARDQHVTIHQQPQQVARIRSFVLHQDKNVMQQAADDHPDPNTDDNLWNVFNQTFLRYHWTITNNQQMTFMSEIASTLNKLKRMVPHSARHQRNTPQHTQRFDRAGCFRQPQVANLPTEDF